MRDQGMVLVDINYSYTNHIIDSAPEFCVARKGTTAAEVKGDPLKVQAGTAGQAAASRSRAKGTRVFINPTLS